MLDRLRRRLGTRLTSVNDRALRRLAPDEVEGAAANALRYVRIMPGIREENVVAGSAHAVRHGTSDRVRVFAAQLLVNQPSADAELRAEAAAVLGDHALRQGRWSVARRHLALARELYELAGHTGCGHQVLLASRQALVDRNLAGSSVSRRELQRLVRGQDQIGALDLILDALPLTTDASDWEPALRHLADLLRTARSETADPVFEAELLQILARSESRIGHHDQAVRHLDLAARLLMRSDEPPLVKFEALVLVRDEWLRAGKPGRALAVPVPASLRDALDVSARPDRLALRNLRTGEVIAQLWSGQSDLVGATLDEVDELTDRRAPGERLDSMLLRAYATMHTDPSGAADLAAQLAKESRLDRSDRATAELVLARSLANLGEPAAAAAVRAGLLHLQVNGRQFSRTMAGICLVLALDSLGKHRDAFGSDDRGRAGAHEALQLQSLIEGCWAQGHLLVRGSDPRPALLARAAGAPLTEPVDVARVVDDRLEAPTITVRPRGRRTGQVTIPMLGDDLCGRSDWAWWTAIAWQDDDALQFEWQVHGPKIGSHRGRVVLGADEVTADDLFRAAQIVPLNVADRLGRTPARQIEPPHAEARVVLGTLGRALIPPVLRDHLAGAGGSCEVIASMDPWLGRVPLGLLAADDLDDVCLLERAVVRPIPPIGVLTAAQPRGRRSRAVDGPVSFVGPPGHPFEHRATTSFALRPTFIGGAGTTRGRRADALAAWLDERRGLDACQVWMVSLQMHPTDVLDASIQIDGEGLALSKLIRDPLTYPMAERVVILPRTAGGDAGGAPLWQALVSVAMACGATTVLTDLFPDWGWVEADEDVVSDLVAVVRSKRPVDALRRWQLDRLGRWRGGASDPPERWSRYAVVESPRRRRR